MTPAAPAPAMSSEKATPAQLAQKELAQRAPVSVSDDVPAKVEVHDLNVYFRTNHAIRHVSLSVKPQTVLAVIGPSGCGKSTFIRALNRMHDLVPGARVEGKVFVDGKDLYARGIDPVLLRRRVGMVFQRPNPFPTMSIFENVAAGLTLNGIGGNHAETVERCLRQAALWDEVKDRLKHAGTSLSGGQQQRLCIARALAVEPEVLLMDEPASALDPIATSRIEDLIRELKKDFTIVIVTHNMQQAARMSDYTAFSYLGELVEYDTTTKIFTNPKQKRTEDYVTGRFG